MKCQLSKTNRLILATVLFTLAVTLACAKNDGRTPEQVVKQYFEYCSKGNFNAAVNLTCFQRACVYDGETSDMRRETTTSAIDRDGKIMDNASSSEDWIKGGWYSPKYIAEEQARIINVVTTKISKNVIEMIIETNNRYNVKGNYVNCLRRERETGNWKIEKVGAINHTETAENDPCFLKMDGYKTDQ